MKQKYSNIAKIIGSSFKGCETRPFEGAYYHDTNGKVVFTDGRRILIISGEEEIHKPIFVGRDGQEIIEKFPNYEMHENRNYEVSWEGEFDLGQLITERSWMKSNKKNVHFKKEATKRIDRNSACETLESVGMFKTQFLADFLRCYRTYHGNRSKIMVVKMKFTRDGRMNVSPLYMETLDGKMKYILMPLWVTLHYAPDTNEEDVILQKQKVF